MKNKCLQLFFGVLPFFCLVFLSVPEVKATESASIVNWNNPVRVISGYTGAGHSSSQTFQAVDNNITKFKILISPAAGHLSMSNIQICEVTSASSNACLGSYLEITTEADPTKIAYLSSVNQSGYEDIDFVFNKIGGVGLTIGSYYKISWNFSNAYTILYTTGNYGYGYSSLDGTYSTNSYYFQVFYDDAYTPPATITGSVYWAGVGTQYGQIGGYWHIPVYWNVCADYDSIKSAGIALNWGEGVGGTTIIEDKSSFIGPQKCQGVTYIDTPVTQIVNATGSVEILLDIVDYSDNTTIVTSTPFNWSVNSGGSTLNYLDFVNETIVNLPTNNGTTTLQANYEFTGLAWSGGKICIYNDDSRSVTELCTDVTTANGLANMNFPNANSPYTLNLHYALYSSTGTNLFNGPSFQINWIGEYKPSDAFQNLLDVSTHELACTTEQWATPDPVLDFGFATTTLAAFNFTKIGCGLMENIYNVGGKIATGLSNALVKITAKTINIFPFVFPVQIKKSWDDATTTTMPSELAFLAIGDDNANITIDIPPLYAGTATTTWTVWGPNLWGNNSYINTMLANWRIITKYLLYAAWFIIVIYAFVTQVMNKIE